MTGPGSFRRAIGYLVGRSPEILFIGGLGNGLVTLVLYMEPTWRTGVFFSGWAVVGGALVFVANFRGRDEIAKGMEPRPWLALVTLQLLYVVVAWIGLSRS